MNNQRIGLVAIPEIINRSWVLQDIELIRSDEISVLPLAIPNTIPNPKVLLWFVKNLRQIFSCDIFFEWFALPQIVFIAKAFGKPVLLNAVGGEVIVYPQLEKYQAGWLTRSLLSAGLRNADGVIAISSDTAKWASRWGARDIRIIYEGIDTEKFHISTETARDKNLIVTVAYLSEYNVIRKGLLTLLDSFSQVLSKAPTATLVIVGEKLDGCHLLVRKAEELGILKSIEFAGSIEFPELIKLLHRASVFVMPSLQEGFPTVCCEALSCELPVVTTNRPTMNEVFTNEQDALLVDADNPLGLARAIIRVLEDHQFARSIAVNGRKLVESSYSKKIRGQKLNTQLSLIMKKGRKYVFNPIWLTIFVISCLIFPIILLIQLLLDRGFRRKWLSVMIKALGTTRNRKHE